MCGIFGYSFEEGAIDVGRRAILGNNLARMNDSRGGDSWGIAVINDGKVSISRNLGNMGFHGYQFLEGNQVLCHTRLATVGAKTVENSHPFEVGDIIGAHNGSVHNHWELDKKYERKCDVDSMHFFYHLNEKRPFEDIEGHGAIEWVDKRDLSKIYLCRLRLGSLSIFGVGDKEKGKTRGIVWSSDDKHIVESLYCAGINDFFPYKVEEGVIYFVIAGKVYIATTRKLVVGEKSTTNRNRTTSTSTNWNSRTREETSSGGGFTGDDDRKEWEEWNMYCEHRSDAEDLDVGAGQGAI